MLDVMEQMEKQPVQINVPPERIVPPEQVVVQIVMLDTLVEKERQHVQNVEQEHIQQVPEVQHVHDVQREHIMQQLEQQVVQHVHPEVIIMKKVKHHV